MENILRIFRCILYCHKFVMMMKVYPRVSFEARGQSAKNINKQCSF